MHARPADSLADSPLAREARDLLRNCVHCGFCLPACPTYRITGSELDSPRGRIYLIKEMLEHGGATATARTHLDRCLTCRACETACPSGVQYGRLADLGRELIEHQQPSRRDAGTRFVRFALARIATRRELFTPLVRVGQAIRPALPGALKAMVPAKEVRQSTTRDVLDWPAARHGRRMAVLEGCVQPGLAPQINAAAARVLDHLGVSLVAARDVGCCGAMEHHLGRTGAALDQVRRNVTASARLLDGGCEAIVSTASGCGTFAKDYGHVLRHAGTSIAGTAARVSAATRDLCEVIDPAALEDAVAAISKGVPLEPVRIAWQAPCSLQHGQRSATAGKVEALLRAAGCELVATRNPTLCCGSAGTYSILQPELARELRTRKLDSLLGDQPAAIATANIGCLEHLRQASPVPVRHWIEIVDSILFP